VRSRKQEAGKQDSWKAGKPESRKAGSRKQEARSITVRGNYEEELDDERFYYAIESTPIG
jgi:hypothetical protein